MHPEGRGRRPTWCAALAALLFFVLCIGPLAAQPDFRFHALPPGLPPALSNQLLSDEERAFVARLPPVRVGLAREGYRPYEDIDAQGVITGIHAEMLVYLARAFGLKLEPVVLADWDSTIQAARRGEVDLLMSMAITAERTEFLEFTLGVTPSPAVRIARRGAPRPAPDQARFAVERGFAAYEQLRQRHPAARVEHAADIRTALAQVARGEADYYVGNLLNAVDALAQAPQPALEVLDIVHLGSGHHHFAVRKELARLAAILNKGIGNLRVNPTPSMLAALAPMPGVSLPAARPLDPGAAAVLAERAGWRIGAVRGLAMLNDIDDNGVHSGIGAEYVQAVARQLGVPLQVVGFANVGAMLDALRAGRIDVVPFLTRTEERAREFSFSAPYVEMPYLIVARSNAPMFWDLSSLNGRRLALAAQHPLRELLGQRYPAIRIVDAADGNDAMDKVARGDADAAIEVKLFANLRINGDNDGRLRAVAVVNDLPAQFRFAAGPQARALIPVIDEALAAIPDSERQRMLRRWVAVDLQPAFPWKRWMPLIATAVTALLLLGAATAWWARRLHREVQRRRRSDQRLIDIGATVPGVAFRYEVSADGRIGGTWFTEGAKAHLGIELDPQRTVLDSLAPHLHPDDLKIAYERQQAAMRSGESFEATGRYRHPDGRTLWLRSVAVHRRNDDGSASWTGYLVDISSERELQERLRREAEARHLLLASASHELRAPAHTLTLALRSLAERGVDASPGAPLAIAHDSAQLLTQLLNDVLDAARLDHGDLSVQPQAVDLRALIDQVGAGTRAWAEGKGLGYASQVDAALPARVLLDPLRLRQMLNNLLSNAIKYTASGRVALHVEAAGAEIVFRVEDSGRGIDAAQLTRLYTPFAAAGGALVPEGSSGLGLSICRRLAQLMGGRLELQSQVGAGTTVEFRLPLQAAPEQTLPPPPAGSTVLVCDDDDTGRLLLASMLRARGHEVAEAADRATALARWQAGGIVAIVTDLELGIDDAAGGAALIAAVRAAEASPARAAPPARTRIVVCSGSLVAEERARLDHDAYLAKPVGPQTLIEALARLGVAAPATAGSR